MNFKFIVLMCLIVLSFNVLTKIKIKPKTKTSREYFFNINRSAFGGAYKAANLKIGESLEILSYPSSWVW